MDITSYDKRKNSDIQMDCCNSENNKTTWTTVDWRGKQDSHKKTHTNQTEVKKR